MQSVATIKKVKYKNEEQEFYAFYYDRVFKAIFCSEEVVKNEDYHLLERLISEATKEKTKVIKIMSPELAVQNTEERTKRLDLLVESNGQMIHMELNTSWGEETIVRNNCFFFSFYSQFTKVGERFDTITKFVHISLNYNMGLKRGLIIDSENMPEEYKKILLNLRFMHVNLDNYKKVWYDNVAKENMKGSLLTLISLRNKDDIIRYADSVDDPEVKECANKLMLLNENSIKSFWNLTPEKENIMMQNAREYLIKEKSEARGIKKGKALGINEGINEGKIDVAKNLVKMNIGADIIKSATGLSRAEIEKLMK